MSEPYIRLRDARVRRGRSGDGHDVHRDQNAPLRPDREATRTFPPHISRCSTPVVERRIVSPKIVEIELLPDPSASARSSLKVVDD